LFGTIPCSDFLPPDRLDSPTLSNAWSPQISALFDRAAEDGGAGGTTPFISKP